MTKLHELLAAEKTPTGAWNTLVEDTIKKFKNQDHFFAGHEKHLQMIADSPEALAEEAKARESKALPTNVHDTLDYALGIFAKAEDLQFRKNATNAVARGTVLWKGQTLLADLPIDELLGLEARLVKIRAIIEAAPTLDASRHWRWAESLGKHVWQLATPERTTKTEKIMVPVEMSPATDKHPAQVQAVHRDAVVGTFETTRLSGACTAVQKSDAIVRIDELLVEVKQARMRANETVAVDGGIAATIVNLIMEPFKN